MAYCEFSPDESREIHRAIVENRPRLACPRCGELLHSDAPAGGRCNTPETWALSCHTCRAQVLVPDFDRDGDPIAPAY